MMNKEVRLNVYESDWKTVKKEVVAEPGKIPFGLVRKVMKILKIEEVKSTEEIINLVMEMWEDVVKVLSIVFPEMDEKDWDYVDTKEIIDALVKMLKHYFKGLISLPTEKNV